MRANDPSTNHIIYFVNPAISHTLCLVSSIMSTLVRMKSSQLKIIGFFATMTQFTSISTPKYGANLIWDSGGEWTGAGKNFVQN